MVFEFRKETKGGGRGGRKGGGRKRREVHMIAILHPSS